MKEIEVVLCDEDKEFATRLIVFLRKREEPKITVRYFRNLEEMEADKPLGDHLLIASGEYEKWIRKKDGSVYAGRVHVLCADRAKEHPKGSIYKYQSVKGILKEMILQKEIDAYLDFLKAGKSDHPANLLGIAGVDPMDDETYDSAEKLINDLMDEFIETAK